MPEAPREINILPKSPLARPAQSQQATGHTWRTYPDSKACPTGSTNQVFPKRKKRQRSRKRKRAQQEGSRRAFPQKGVSKQKRDATIPSKTGHDEERPAVTAFRRP